MVDLARFKVTGTIETGLHPTGMAFWGKKLLVANAYSDSISVIDTTSNEEVRRIDLGLPIGVPGEDQPAYGVGPNSIAIDATKNIAYVALYNANAIAVRRTMRCSLPTTKASAPLASVWHRLRRILPKIRTPSIMACPTLTPTRTLAPSASFPFPTAQPCGG